MSTAQLKSIATGEATKQQLAAMPPKKQIAHLLESRKGEIAKMLPRHLSADRLLKVAQIAATTTPALLECEIPSLVSAIGQCAQMGLEPNTVLGHAYLVPFKAKRKKKIDMGNGKLVEREEWVKLVQVIIGYKGLIDLARRSGQIVSIAAHEVCANDHLDLVYGLEEKLEHKPAMQERGEVVGFYAVAKLVGGGHAFEFMSKHEVDMIMLASQSKGNYGPWKDHYTEMGRKTVIRRLAKYLPLSIEFQAAAALDEMATRGEDQKLDESTIDGDFVFAADGAADGAHVDPDTGEVQPPAQQEPAAIAFDYAGTLSRIQHCADVEVLDLIGDDLRDLPEGDERVKLMAAYEERRTTLQGV